MKISTVMSFDEAISESRNHTKRHVLLGNGFSIACRPNIFVYGRLFEQADFSALSPAAKEAFGALSTQDFEHVIQALRDASKLVKLYKGISADVNKKMKEDAEGLKNVLVNTIAASHPDMPSDVSDDEYSACRKFLSNFHTTYTLNYDLLLYWAQMHVEEGEKPSSDDGFRKPDGDFEAHYVTWEPHQSHEQNTWFLHGALHVFDAGTEVQKYTWINTGVRLIEQIRDALRRDYFPLFVAEGTSREKQARIRHSDYLAKAYRSFCEIGGCLFIYGHSLAENDEHFLRRIEKGKISHLYVGIYGDPNSNDNKRIMRRANHMSVERGNKRPLKVSFYDSQTAHVWGRQ
jgi:hypothetical protein